MINHNPNTDLKERVDLLLSTAENLWQENNWRTVRHFCAELQSLAEYLSPDELEFFIFHCCEMLFHKKGAVRRMSARTTGILVSCLGDRLPDVWERLLHRMLFPKNELSEQKSQWTSYSLMSLVENAVSRLDEASLKHFLRIYFTYFRSVRWEQITCLNLLSGIMSVNPKLWTPLQKHEIFGFMRNLLTGEWQEGAVMSLLLLKTWKDAGWTPQEDEMLYLKDFTLPENAAYAEKYLLAQLVEGNEASVPEGEIDSTETILQKNMQVDTHWTMKLAHLDILKNRLKSDAADSGLTRSVYASHLLTLHRLGGHPMTYMKIGEDLISIMPELSALQKYEILQDILKELETGVDSSNYISTILGRCFHMLSPEDKAEFIEKFDELLDNDDPTIEMTVLDTLCRACRFSPEAQEGLPELISKGLYSYRKDISDETAFLIDYFDIEDLVKGFGADGIHEADRDKVAFFSAIFDPFTLRDRAILKEILDMGYHVLLAVNDFDCEKNPQPYSIRKKLLQMSVADLKNVDLLPEEISIFCENPQDLAKLHELYPGKEIWLVKESAQLENITEAEAHYPHLICAGLNLEEHIDRASIMKILKSDAVLLTLPAIYQDISSEELQKRIHEKRNISQFANRQVRRMISDWELYTVRPPYKKMARARSLVTEFEDGRLTVHTDSSEELFASGTVIWRRSGKTAVISEILSENDEDLKLRDFALTELMAHLQSSGFTHAVCFDAGKYENLLKPFGFLPMKEYEDGITVNLSSVAILFPDVQSVLREPYSQDEEVLRIIHENQLRLRHAICGLYPGKLVLSLPVDIVNSRLIDMITDRSEGKICVPFGNILKGVTIPGVTSRELNTEKRYTADLSRFEICEFPEYRSLNAQIETLKSFGKPITLVDDLYHKGYRFQKITEMMRSKDVEVSSLVVSVISGHGISLTKDQDVDVKALYTVPNMSIWLLESDLYPYVGGDGIEGEELTSGHAEALASINTILPYEMPGFMGGAAPDSIYHLSEVSMNNSIRLYETLEKIYRASHQHSLTLNSIQDVMSEPRYPQGIDSKAMGNRKISDLLRAELQKLKRLNI